MTKSGLTAKQRAQIKQELIAERTRLGRAMRMRDVRQSVSTPATEFGVPTYGAGGDVALTLVTSVDVRYTEILDALSRLAAGTYGFCVNCEGPIPYGRLLVMPEVTRCVACGPRL